MTPVVGIGSGVEELRHSAGSRRLSLVIVSYLHSAFMSNSWPSEREQLSLLDSGLMFIEADRNPCLFLLI